MSLEVKQSACQLCGKPATLTLSDGTRRTMMLETSTENTTELDTPLLRMGLLTDMLNVCAPTTTLGEICSNGNYHTSSTQYRWFDAMPKEKTLGWLIHMEEILHPETAQEGQHKKKKWDLMMAQCYANSRPPPAN